MVNTKKVILAPQKSKLVHGYVRAPARIQRLHVITEPDYDMTLPLGAVCAAPYGEMTPGDTNLLEESWSNCCYNPQ